MRMNRSSMGMLFALCALTACSDEGDGLNDSQESLRRGQLADGGSVQGRRDRDDDTDEATEEGDGGKRGRGHDQDEGDGGKRGRGRFGGYFADGGCRGPRGAFGGARDDRDDDDRDESAEEDEPRGPGGRGGKGPGKGQGWFDGGVAP